MRGPCKLESAEPRFSIWICGLTVSPGERLAGSASAIARSSGSGWLVTCTATGVLRLFEWRTSGVLFDELARNHTKNLPPAAAKPFGRDGSVNESTSCSTLFCESGGAWIVPSDCSVSTLRFVRARR